MNPLSKYRGLAHLLAVVVLLPLLAWRLALGDTVGKWREAQRTEKQLVQMRTQSAAPVPEPVAATAEHIRDGVLLDQIVCGPAACEVVRYTPYITGSTEGVTVHTAEIVLNTDYLGAVRIIDRIERTMPASRLRSVAMRTLTPRGSKQPQLHATLIVQQIEQKNGK